MTIFALAFWKATAERAVSTAAQSALLIIGADQVNAVEVDWPTVLGFAAGGALLTVAKSLAASRIGNAGPSFANEVVVPTGTVAGPTNNQPSEGVAIRGPGSGGIMPTQEIPR